MFYIFSVTNKFKNEGSKRNVVFYILSVANKYKKFYEGSKRKCGVLAISYQLQTSSKNEASFSSKK